jgi:hypothetical protein
MNTSNTNVYSGFLLSSSQRETAARVMDTPGISSVNAFPNSSIDIWCASRIDLVMLEIVCVTVASLVVSLTLLLLYNSVVSLSTVYF